MPTDVRSLEESPAVQAHLTITQSVIQRMASNSSSCKAWCITLVSAILVIVADKSKAHYSLLAMIPTVLFLALDAYYLSLELRIRAAYNAFIEKLHKGRLQVSDLYVVKPAGSAFKAFGSAL
jgi:uncharacterized membrane protein